MEQTNQGGGEGQGHDRAFTAAGSAAGVAQQPQPPLGRSEITDLGDRLQERQFKESENSGEGMAAASTSPNDLVNNIPSAPAPVRATKVVQERPAQLIMDDVWLPWCQGREFIEFAAGLTDLSKETF